MISLPITYAEVGAIYAHCVNENKSSVLFAASEPGSGTSTVAYAVAQRAAAAGRRTVLVDFNTHSSYTTGELALEPTQWGFGGTLKPDSVLRFEGSNLAVIPAPSRGGFSVDSRDRESVLTFVRQLRERFDFVVADAPCLGRPNRSGLPTALAASAFDCCLLLILSGRTAMGVVETAVGQLLEQQACLAGVVMVDRDMPPLRSELVRQAAKISRFWPGFPRLLDRLLGKFGVMKVEC
jgi:Mrp family chromosome partitioning ATPase